MVPRLGEWKGQTQGWGLWIDQDSHREEDASAVYQAVPQNGGQGVFKTHQSPKENQIKFFTKFCLFCIWKMPHSKTNIYE